MKLSITVHYRTPSLNKTKRQHWTAQLREKRKAFAALQSALQATASDHSIRTTSPQAAKIYWTAYATLSSFLATNPGASHSKQNRFKSQATHANAP